MASLRRVTTSDPGLPESRVLIIVTGGTICMKKSDRGLVPARNFLKFGLAGRPSFNDQSYPEPLDIVVDDDGKKKAVQSLRTPISTYDRAVRYAVLEFETLLDSSSIDAAGWDQIATCIYRNYRLYDGFVVLHGTDSLAYTASALSFMLQHLGKPVILTGSQAPIMELQTDAEANMLNALIIAGHFMIPEVCLCFDGKLFRGNRCTKISAEDFNAFDSPNFPPLAEVTALRTRIRWDLVHRPAGANTFSLQTKLDTAHVACIRIFPGIRAYMIDAVLKTEGLKGLVLESYGAGNTPGNAESELNQVLINAVKRGIVIVNVTQCLTGSVTALYEAGTALSRAGIVFGSDMTSEAALTKLSYLLALPDANPGDIAKEMAVSIRGELSDSPRMLFSHPHDGALNPHLSSLTALAYAIEAGDLDQVRAIMRAESRYLLNDADYTGNTPMVSPALIIDGCNSLMCSNMNADPRL